MSGVQSSAADLDVDLRQLFASLARNWLRILVVALIVAGLAFALAWLTTPLYKSETRLLIEARESVFTRPNTTNDADRPLFDEEGVTSQVEVVSSTDILKQVAKQLNLSTLPEFDETVKMSSISRLLILAGLKSDPNEIPPEERVLKKMHEKLNVYRVERSRVIVIEFSSRDPKLAADVPNAIADAYLALQRGAKLQSNTEATDWLAPEIADLSKRVKDAEAKVAEYRAQSDLLIGQNNSVLATQQLSEMSSELSRVRANRASAEATAQGVRKALQSGGSLDSLPEVMSSAAIQRLRDRQGQIKSDIADLSTTLLDNHPRIRSLKSQLADIDGQIRTEAQKVLAGLVTEADTAKERESQLVADLNRLKAESARAGEEQVELNALEREATAQRQLLESYLTRYREASSRQDRNYLPVDARIFSRAIVPTEPYFPKMLPIVGAAFAASLLVMAIITLLRELFSGRAMRPASGPRPEPVREVPMPAVRDDDRPVPPVAKRDLMETTAPAARLQASDDERAAAVRKAAALIENAAVGRPAVKEKAPEPSDAGLGEIDIEKAAERLITSGAARAIFVSPEGDEAAASSILVAREVADAGLRVLLMDLTASGAASRPLLDSSAYAGITNLLASEAQFSDVIHADHYSDCHVIPAGTADPMRAMRAADRLPIIMQSLTTAYDLVVVECGPADADGIRRLVGEATEVFVSVLEPSEAITEAAVKLIESGYPDLILVTPAGHGTPGAPVSGRSAA
ncbi:MULTISPECIES: GumC family protein [Phyllobacteriaceae]|jgi:exopolysaccharide transport family protein|uniref:Chain-length determining protein n=1 Tax=Mesorhizobium hungaricum TaxID=1566387 RepID=A0A1C2DMU7_9HYPH|nr:MULTISPECIES: exopolysaccharide transport family protein [Mesorhizobium]MBN9236954.1 exopolysaccharide transport family protein [Mesorhizobium sp.]OCX16091.1 chain-length determining protein [Mesorhizobium hungaricum]